MADIDKSENGELIILLREKKSMSEKAFNEIYKRFSDSLFSYCLFKTGNKDDAKELCQETWVKFYEYASNREKEICLPAILYKIAINLRINEYNSPRSRIYIGNDNFDMEQVADSLDLERYLEKKELFSIIKTAVNYLPDKYRETFIFKWYMGLSYKEISNILDESVECVKQRGSRAMCEMLNILKPVINELSS